MLIFSRVNLDHHTQSWWSFNSLYSLRFFSAASTTLPAASTTLPTASPTALNALSNDTANAPPAFPATVDAAPLLSLLPLKLLLSKLYQGHLLGVQDEPPQQ